MSLQSDFKVTLKFTSKWTSKWLRSHFEVISKCLRSILDSPIYGLTCSMLWSKLRQKTWMTPAYIALPPIPQSGFDCQGVNTSFEVISKCLRSILDLWKFQSIEFWDIEKLGVDSLAVKFRLSKGWEGYISRCHWGLLSQFASEHRAGKTLDRQVQDTSKPLCNHFKVTSKSFWTPNFSKSQNSILWNFHKSKILLKHPLKSLQKRCWLLGSQI